MAEYTALVGNDPAPAAQVSYLTQDHLGSPRVVTNQNGEVIKRTDWMAFGEEVEFNKRTSGLGYDEVPETRKGYTGYEKDDESGLDFAQARYYNPKHGRYTSVDPLTASANVKNPQTFNRYSYVLNSPYKFVDPLGLISETTGGGFRCNFKCRVGSAMASGLPLEKSGLSQADIHLVRFHIENGTALGHTFLRQRSAAGSRNSFGVGRPVTASEQRVTTGNYSRNGASGGGAVLATFSRGLAADATSIAQTSEQNLVAYTKNRDLALKSSRAFIMAIDDDNIEPIDDVKDLIVERSYGTVASDGSVILPESVSTGAIGEQHPVRA
ncbi:MAG: RHS repeat-associated core domain-containing protein [Acidobacteria bacterium]|nr:RHS repeat-associated core domain-containing protein [Acidobacteriota bacterium]